MPHLVNPPRPDCRLIIDWTGPNHWVWTFDEMVQCEEVPRMQVGEADIKFIKWAAQFHGLGLAAEAVDGDFVPIALLSNIPRICVLRLECCSLTPDRTYEWVDIDTVRLSMRNEINRLVEAPPHWEMKCLAALIAMTGTDFSRSLPMIGPKRLWFVLPSIIKGVLASFQGDELDAQTATERIIAPLYRAIYTLHAGIATTFDNVMGNIMRSKLSATTKARMPSRNQCRTTVRNANFLLKYWNAEAVDCMVDHGFRLNGAVIEWDD